MGQKHVKKASKSLHVLIHRGPRQRPCGSRTRPSRSPWVTALRPGLSRRGRIRITASRARPAYSSRMGRPEPELTWKMYH